MTCSGDRWIKMPFKGDRKKTQIGWTTGFREKQSKFNFSP